MLGVFRFLDYVEEISACIGIGDMIRKDELLDGAQSWELLFVITSTILSVWVCRNRSIGCSVVIFVSLLIHAGSICCLNWFAVECFPGGMVLFLLYCLISAGCLLPSSVAIWLTRKQSVCRGLISYAVSSVLANYMFFSVVPFGWIVSNVPVFFVDTPFAFLTRIVSTFWLAIVLQCLMFFWAITVFDGTILHIRRLYAAGLVTLALWLFGSYLGSQSNKEPLAVSIVVVQPNGKRTLRVGR
jgi:hypothetical protein